MTTNATDPNPSLDTPPRLLDTAEVARQLNSTERQVARLRQSGKLGSVRLTGSAVRHTQAQVDAYIAACTIPAKAVN
jgi:excisionase family DNA binding protein